MATSREPCEVGRDSLGTSTAQPVLLIAASSYISICSFSCNCSYARCYRPGTCSGETGAQPERGGGVTSEPKGKACPCHKTVTCSMEKRLADGPQSQVHCTLPGQYHPMSCEGHLTELGRHPLTATLSHKPQGRKRLAAFPLTSGTMSNMTTLGNKLKVFILSPELPHSLSTQILF